MLIRHSNNLLSHCSRISWNRYILPVRFYYSPDPFIYYNLSAFLYVPAMSSERTYSGRFVSRENRSICRSRP